MKRTMLGSMKLLLIFSNVVSIAYSFSVIPKKSTASILSLQNNNQNVLGGQSRSRISRSLLMSSSSYDRNNKKKTKYDAERNNYNYNRIGGTTSNSLKEGVTNLISGKLLSIFATEKKIDIELHMNWLLPPSLSLIAFFTYDEIRAIFHFLIDIIAGNSWLVADGGKYMAEIIRPILNGPITVSISILLGTLVATTISNLYNRQITIEKMITNTVEEIRELRLLIQGFPNPYRNQGIQLLHNQFDGSVKYFFDSNIDINNSISNNLLRDKNEMGTMLLLLNELSKEQGKNDNISGFILAEAYGCVHRMKDYRAQLITSIETTFAPAHYVNILTLAGTLLFVFLLETDQDAMQFLLGFQLSTCWALLIGIYTLLGVVIYDLSTPFSGGARILSNNNNDAKKSTVDDFVNAGDNYNNQSTELDAIRNYALALDQRLDIFDTTSSVNNYYNYYNTTKY